MRGAKLEQSQIDRLDTLNSLLGIGAGGSSDASATNQTTQITAANLTNTNIGATTESASPSDTTSGVGLNGRLQRIAQRITSLIGLLPSSLGAKTAANSLAVTLSTDGVASGIFTQIGEVQASPTANTVLARLKSIADALVFGSKTSANSISVTPSSDGIFKTGTAPASKIITLIFTRVANTNNYAIDDQWGDLRQEAIFGIAGEGYWLTAINLVSSLSTLPTGYGSFSLFIFNSSTNAGSGIADNDPMTRRTFAIQAGSGINLITPSKAVNDLTANSYTGNLREQIHLTGTDLWFRLVTRTAINSPLAAADTITLTLRFAGMT